MSLNVAQNLTKSIGLGQVNCLDVRNTYFLNGGSAEFQIFGYVPNECMCKVLDHQELIHAGGEKNVEPLFILVKNLAGGAKIPNNAHHYAKSLLSVSTCYQHSYLPITIFL